MILVTGGTGFIGKALIRHLVEIGYPVRSLIRPSARSPDLPQGVPVDVAVSSLSDTRGLRAAMVGVDIVYHLASSEWRGPQASLMDTDIRGTRSVVESALDAGVQRFFYVSHLDADRGSAYPVLKAKGIAEETIRRSGINYTILRAAIVFGANDGLTTGIARILSASPLYFVMPGDGNSLLQPLWVEDLATCLTWALDDAETENRLFEVGGPEYLPFNQIVELVMQTTGIRRRILHIRPPYLRGMTTFVDSIFPTLPVSVYWIDYLAASRTCALDTVPRAFNLLPSRFSQRLEYLKGQNWGVSFLRGLFTRGR